MWQIYTLSSAAWVEIVSKNMGYKEKALFSLRKNAAMIIEAQYFGPIQTFARMLHADQVVIEQHEHFVKSSYRNRCNICSPNGSLTLSIPILGGKGIRRAIKDVEIDNSEAWQVLHWRSLASSYRNSPYFEYYEDSLKPFFEQEYRFLFELNMEITQWVNQQLQLGLEWTFSGAYEKHVADDFRSAIHPSPARHKEDAAYTAPSYIQVFGDRHGFLANRSILDLMFNEGPNARTLMKGSVEVKR